MAKLENKKIFFVNGAVEGDYVYAKVIKDKIKFAEAKV